MQINRWVLWQSVTWHTWENTLLSWKTVFNKPHEQTEIWGRGELLYHLTIDQSPSWKANKFSASQHTAAFYGNERLIKHSQKPAACPHPGQSNPCNPQTTSWRQILMLPSYLHLGLPCGFLLSDSPTKPLHASLPSTSQSMLHTSSTSFLFIWSS